MLIIPAALSVAAGIVICRKYAAYVVRGQRQLRGFIALLRRIRERIGCYLESVSEAVRGWECSPLSELGFLSRIGQGVTPSEALRCVRRELVMPSSALLRLESLFGELGGGYREDELSRIDSAVADLTAILESAEREGEKNIKGTSATVMAVAVGIAIFII